MSNDCYKTTPPIPATWKIYNAIFHTTCIDGANCQKKSLNTLPDQARLNITRLNLTCSDKLSSFSVLTRSNQIRSVIILFVDQNRKLNKWYWQGAKLAKWLVNNLRNLQIGYFRVFGDWLVCFRQFSKYHRQSENNSANWQCLSRIDWFCTLLIIHFFC